MSSSQLVLAYGCDRADQMSPAELRLRLDAATELVEQVVSSSLARVEVGDGRSGLVVWTPDSSTHAWPSIAVRGEEAAAWMHVPAAAGGIADPADPISLARDLVEGTRDAAELGAPCAALHWAPTGLRIVNDRLGMVRLYAFEVPGFGYVWSSRPGLAHVFAGVSPKLEHSVWSDMATLGWAGGGSAHLGNGHQMPASSRVHVDVTGSASTASDRDGWIREMLAGEPPTIKDSAQGMVRSLEVATWWPGRPTADLTGGKDSRVTAAAAICAGVVDRVRTVNTDTGEVDTARELVRLAGDPVAHRVDPVVEPRKPVGGVLERYLSMQRAWEGAYNARSAYRSNPFTGFRPSSAPRINGLGGEAVQGRTMLSPVWIARMEGQGADAGRERLSGMVRSGAVAVAEESVESSMRTVARFGNEAEELGMTSAYMVVDYFYNFSKMPFWSMPQATMNTLLPFYSPGMLPRIVAAMFEPKLEYGRLHRQLLQEMLPAWSTRPFYKGSPATRAIPWMWENEDWGDVSAYIRDGLGALDTFAESEVLSYVAEADAGRGNVRSELAFSRVMWELSFCEYAREVAELSESTARRVEELRPNARSS